jgi:hypothetical protein
LRYFHHKAYEWLKAHGFGSRCPDAEDLICLMEIADQEGAPHSIATTA